MPSTRRARTQQSVFAKEVAKHYVKEVEKIRAVLKQKRKEYKEAAAKEKKAKTQEAIDALKEIMANADAEFEAEKSDWPYYRKYEFSRSQNVVISDGLDSAPYSPEADPFPGDGALIKLSMSERARIVETAMLARRGVKDKKRMLEGIVPRINAADSIHEFKHYIRKYINPKPYTPPPSYPRGSSEDDEDDYEQWQNPDVLQRTPPAIPYANTRAPTYRYRPARTHVVTPEGSPGLAAEGTTAAPAYSSPDYPLGEGGRKTRKHKRKRRQTRKTSKHSK
jgi:hypothetical protein